MPTHLVEFGAVGEVLVLSAKTAAESASYHLMNVGYSPSPFTLFWESVESSSFGRCSKSRYRPSCELIR